MPSDIYTQHTHHPDRFREEGYAWGLFSPGPEWLTVLGSHWENIPLTESPDEAARPGVRVLDGDQPKPYILAKVRRCGQDYFQVLEVERTYTPEPV